MVRCRALLAFVAAAAFPGVAGAQWQSAAVLAGPLPDVRDSQVGIDAQGNATVLYGAAVGPSQSTSEHPPPGPEDQLFARTWNADGSMGDPVELGATVDLDGYQLAVNARGDAVAVWDMWTDTGTVVEVATRPAGGAFGSARTVSERYGYGPSVAIDAAGDYVVAWERPGGGELTSLEEATVGRVEGAPPAPGTTIGKGDYEAAPAVAIDGKGDIVAAWRSRRMRLVVSSRPHGGRFGRARAISQNRLEGHRPTLEMNPRGDAAAMWVRDTETGDLSEYKFRMEVAAWRFGGRLPSRGRPVTPVSSFSEDDPVLAIDRGGDILGVWARDDRQFHANLETWRHIAGGAFPKSGTRRGLDEGGGYTTAMDARGTAFLAWQRYTVYGDSGEVDALMTATWPAGGPFTAPLTFQPSQSGLGRPQIAAAGNGRAALVWTQRSEDGSASVMASRYGG